MAMREGETDKGRYIKLLEKYDWDLWGQLSAISARDSRREIIERFEDWLDDLEEEECDRELRWVRTYEKGLDGDDDSVRILIGGLRNRTRLWQQRWSSKPLTSHLHDFNKFNRAEAMRFVLDLRHQREELDIKYKLR
jgi:hypothetical protein